MMDLSLHANMYPVQPCRTVQLQMCKHYNNEMGLGSLYVWDSSPMLMFHSHTTRLAVAGAGLPILDSLTLFAACGPNSVSAGPSIW